VGTLVPPSADSTVAPTGLMPDLARGRALREGRGPRIPRHARPLPNETLISYLGRLACANGLPYESLLPVIKTIEAPTVAVITSLTRPVLLYTNMQPA